MKHLLVAAVIGGLALACSGDSPTRSSTPFSAQPPGSEGVVVIDDAIIERQNRQLRAFFDDMSAMGRAANVRSTAAHEDFDCTAVEEVRARFSDPGFVNGLRVGLFVKFIGIPAGTKKLRIWWDYEDEFATHQDVFVGDGDVNREDPTKFDISMVVEHAYENAGRKLVRVELIVKGSSGNCARNREVVVAPGSLPRGASFDHIVTFAGVANCVSGFGRSMGIWANFNPGIPAGTSYTVTFRVDATGVGGGSFTNAMVGDTPGTDTTTPPGQTAPPPNTFTATVNPTVTHNQLQVATQIFAFPTPPSMSTRILSIDVPGKTVLIVDNLFGTCP